MKIDDKSLEEQVVGSSSAPGQLPAASELEQRLRNPSLSPVHEVIDLVKEIMNSPSEEGTALILGLAKRIFAQEGDLIPIYKDNELQRLCLAYLWQHATSDSRGVAQVAMASNDPDIQAYGYLIVCSDQHPSVIKEMLRNLEPHSRATVLATFGFSGDERLSDLARDILSERDTPDLAVIKRAA